VGGAPVGGADVGGAATGGAEGGGVGEVGALVGIVIFGAAGAVMSTLGASRVTVPLYLRLVSTFRLVTALAGPWARRD